MTNSPSFKTLPIRQDDSAPPLAEHDMTEFVRKYSLAVEDLTEHQVADAIRQAIRSGDFRLRIVADLGQHRQSVSYIPGVGMDELRERYNELIYAVATIIPGESRHETALRFIKERQTHQCHDEGYYSMESETEPQKQSP